MRIVESGSPFPIYEFDSNEFMLVEPNTMCVCDFCNSLMNDKVYLLPHVNRAVCENCYKSFVENEKKLDYEHDDELLSEMTYYKEDVKMWEDKIKKIFGAQK